MQEDNVKKLYNALSEQYNVGDYDTFSKKMADPENRKKAYDAASQRYDLGDYNTFEQKLGIATPSTNSIQYNNTPAAQESGSVNNRVIPNIDTTNIPKVDNVDQVVEQAGSEIAAENARREQLRENVRKQAEQYEKLRRDAAIARSKADAKSGSTGITFSGSAGPVFTSLPTEEQTKAEENLSMASTTSQRANKALQLTNEAERTKDTNFLAGVKRGFVDRITDVDTWDYGILDKQQNKLIGDAAAKFEQGATLSQSEKNLLDAFALDTAAQQEFGKDLGRGYKAGSLGAESTPFALELLLSPLSGIGKTAVKYGVRKLGVELFSSILKQKAVKAGLRAGGDLVGAAGMAVTSGLPSVIADTERRMTGDAIPLVHNEGVEYGGAENQEKLLPAFGKSLASKTIENYSEMFGEYFTPIGAVLGKAGGKALNKIGLKSVNDFIGNVGSSIFAKSVDDFMGKTQWHGFVGEWGEEQVGTVMHALVDGDSKMSDLLDMDKQIDIALGVATMTGALSAVKTIGYRRPGRREEKLMNKADESAATLLGDRWGKIREGIDNSDSESVSKLIQSDLSGMSNEEATAVLEYAVRLQQYRGVNIGEIKRREELSPEQLSIEDSFTEGLDLDLVEATVKRETKVALDEASQDVDTELLNSPEAMESIFQQAKEGKDVSKELNYLNKKARYEGMLNGITDGIDDKIEAESKAIDDRTHKASGNIITVTPQSDDMKRMFVISGNIVQDKNGYVDRNASDKAVIVRNENGDLEMRPATDFYQVNYANSEETKTTRLDQLRQMLLQQAADEIDTPTEEEKADAISSVRIGDELDLNINGQPASAFVAQSETPSGTIILQFNAPIMDANGKKVSVMEVSPEELQAMLLPKEDGTIITPVNEAIAETVELPQNVSNVSAETGENAVTPPSEQSNVSETTAPVDPYVDYPKDDKGELDIEKFTPEQSLFYAEKENGKEFAISIAGKASKALQETRKKIDKKIETEGNPAKLIKLEKEKTEIDRQIGYYHDYIVSKETPAPSETASPVQAAAENIVTKWSQTPKVEGVTDEIALANGEKVKGKYVLVDAQAPTPSHNPRTFAKSEGFPVNENGSTVNDRDYEKDKNAQMIVMQTANQYDQRALQTPVIVSKEGIVLSGNQRTMSGQLAAEHGTDTAYNEYLKQYSAKYGFTPEQVESVQHPRVVFVPESDMPYNTETFAKFNADDKKTQNKTEQAVKAGKAMQEKTVNKIAVMLDGYNTLAEMYADARSSKELVGYLVEDGVIGNNEIAEMMDGDILSVIGQDRIENILVGSVLEESAVRQMNKMKDLRQPIIKAMAEIAANRRFPTDNNFMKEISEAINLVYEGRTSGAIKKGDPVADALLQQGLFEQKEYGAVVQFLANLLNKNQTAFKKALSLYNDTVREQASGQTDMFESEPRTKEAIVEDIKKLIGYEHETINTGREGKIATSVDRESTTGGESIGTGTAEQQSPAEPAGEPTGTTDTGAAASTSETVSGDTGAQPVDRVEPVQETSSGKPSKESAPVDLFAAAQTAVSTHAVKKDIAAAEQEVNTEPTEAQKEAGNYKMGHIKIGNHDITIENPKGSTRSGVDKDGKQWSTEMKNSYGYFRGTRGKDGDHVDVFIGENPLSEKVFVVDQNNPETGAFDEHKVMLGFNSMEEAKEAYLSNYEQGWKGFGNITETSNENFEAWLNSGTRKSKPFADYKQNENETVERSVQEQTDAPSNPVDIFEAARQATQKKEESEPETSETEESVVEEETEKLPKEKEKSSSEIEKITDVGEKIGGAKKDLFVSYRDRIQGVTEESIISLPLSKVFPRPDLKAMVENNNLSQDNAIFLSYMYDNIPPKPRMEYRLKSWAEKVQNVIDIFNELTNSDINLSKEWLKVEGRERDGYYYDLYYRTMKSLNFPMDSIKLGNYKIGKSAKGGYEVRDIRSGGGYYIKGRFDTFEEAIEKLKSMLGAKKEGKSVQEFSIYQLRKDKTFIITPNGKSSIVLQGGFTDLKETREYLSNNRSELTDRYKAMRELPNERKDVNRERVGSDHRNGKDITAQDFRDQFGFRGVEFGNWVNQEERQSGINEAYDALMDLATVINVSPQALSLGGQLGFAFGARGSGKASAHYEPIKVVINLTKTHGAGSLAHEWWHAVDNYFSRQGGNANSYITTNPSHPINKDVRSEVVKAFSELMNVIRKSPFNERSAKIDNLKSNKYWSLPTELGARSFEGYVSDKMFANGYQNDYLVNYKKFGEWREESTGMEDNYPYPTLEESRFINEKYDQLFQTIQEKVDEEGNTILFREQEEDVFYSKAKDYFGTTNNTNIAGYLLKDGSLLDFSGKKFGSDGKERTIDHREISDAYPEENVDMVSFTSLGNVRMMPESDGFEVVKDPTIEQRSVLRRYISKVKGSVYVDYSLPNGDIAFSIEYFEGTKPDRVLNDISNYFANGVRPVESNMRFRESEGVPDGAQAYQIYNHPTTVAFMRWFSKMPKGFLLKDGVIDRNAAGRFNDGFKLFAREMRDAMLELSAKKDEGTQMDLYKEMADDLEYAMKFYEDIASGKDVWHGDLPRFRENQSLEDRLYSPIESIKKKIERYTSPIGFYSTVEDALSKITQEKGTKDQFRAMLLKNGAKQVEMDWMGFDELPDKLTKEDIQNLIDSNRIDVEEVEKGKGEEDDYRDAVYNHVRDVLARIGELDVANEETIDRWYNNPTEENKWSMNALLNEYNIDIEYIEDMATTDVSTTKYSQYVLPGGKNYRELLLTMPDNKVTQEELEDTAIDIYKTPYSELNEAQMYNAKQYTLEAKKKGRMDKFKSSHFEEPNILAHIRFDEREINGERVLFIEEFQSDWAQEGKKKGFKDKNLDKKAREVRAEIDALRNEIEKDRDKDALDNNNGVRRGNNLRDWVDKYRPEKSTKFDALVKQLNSINEINKGGVPSMPFNKTDQWVNLAMRRMMRYAAENGFDRIAWTNGEQQAERYDLSKQADEIVYNKLNDGKTRIIVKKGGKDVAIHDAEQNEIEGFVGKEIAQKIQNNEGSDNGVGKSLSGLDLKVGGAGMKAFYDNIVPKAAKKLVKPFGAKLEDMQLEDKSTVQSVPVTESMRASVMGGVPIFRGEPSALFQSTTFYKKEQIKKAAESLAKELNTPIRFVTREKMPKGHSTAKGYYLNGEVVICAENHDDVADVQSTILHEIVAHKGLREMFGDNFKSFLREVYGNASKEVRAAINNISRKYGYDVSIATEEYMASIAENGVGLSVWNKIQNYFRNMLSKLGLDLKITDNDIKYILWRSYQHQTGESSIYTAAKASSMRFRLFDSNAERNNIIREAKAAGTYLKAPNGEATNLTPEQWVTVRTESFKNWFGDWEKNPEKSSKIVDKNGEPLVVYHGTNNKFNTFKPHFAEGLGFGIYTTDSRKSAEEYGSIIKELFCDMKKPYRYEEFEIKKTKAYKEYRKKLIEKYDYEEEDNAANPSFYDISESESEVLNKAIQELGYDGISILEANSITGWYENLSFSPDKLKSATDNNGEFDPDNNDIRFREDAPADYEERMQEASFKWRESYQDSMLALKEYQEQIERKDGEVKDIENAYMSENSMSSRSAYETEFFLMNQFRAMEDAIKKLLKSRTYEDIKAYAVAKHGLERNKVFAWRDALNTIEDPEEKEQIEKEYNDQLYLLKKSLEKGAIKRDKFDQMLEEFRNTATPAYALFRGQDYSGLTDLTGEKDFEAAAQMMVDEFEKGVESETAELWKSVNEATKATLKKTFDSGLMTRSTYDKVRNMFEFYVPLRGWDEKVAHDVYEYITSDKTSFNAPLKVAKGRKSMADDPFATIGNMAESGILQGNRNLMKQRFLNLALNHPNKLLSVKGMWYENIGTEKDPEWVRSIPDIPNDATPEEVNDIVEQHDEHMKELQAQGLARQDGSRLRLKYRASAREKSEHAVIVKMGGKEYVIFVNGNPRLAQAVNGLTNPDATEDKDVKFIKRVNRMLSKNFTTRNPAFILSNMSRDLLFSTTAVSIKENGSYAKNFIKNATANVGLIWSLMQKYKANKLDMNNERERLFSEFIQNGGETGYTALNNVDEYKKIMQRDLKKIKGQIGSISHAGTSIVEAIGFMNRCAEDVSRFSAYMTSRQDGRTIERSIYDAKEISVNFNKKGAGGRGSTRLKNLYLFFNAAVQGLNNFNELRKKNAGKFYTAVGGFAAAGIFVPILNEVLLSLIGDDDDKDAYNNLPDWVRKNNFVIWAGGDKFITIPLPIELRAFYGLGEIFYQLGSGNMKGKKKMDIALDMANQITELLPLNPLGNGGNVPTGITDAMAAFSPDALKPVLQVAANKDFFGLPIYKDFDYNKNMPAYTKAYSGTNKELIKSAELLNAITGGDKYKPGSINANPSVIEHLVESYLGGMGKTVNQTVKTIQAVFSQDEEVLSRNVPVLNRFLSSTDDKTAFRKVNEMYFDYLNEYKSTEQQLRGYKKEMEKGDASFEKKLDSLYKSKAYDRYELIHSYKKILDDYKTFIDESEGEERATLKKEQDIIKAELVDQLAQIK